MSRKRQSRARNTCRSLPLVCRKVCPVGGVATRVQPDDRARANAFRDPTIESNERRRGRVVVGNTTTGKPALSTPRDGFPTGVTDRNVASGSTSRRSAPIFKAPVPQATAGIAQPAASRRVFRSSRCRRVIRGMRRAEVTARAAAAAACSAQPRHQDRNSPSSSGEPTPRFDFAGERMIEGLVGPSVGSRGPSGRRKKRRAIRVEKQRLARNLFSDKSKR